MVKRRVKNKSSQRVDTILTCVTFALLALGLVMVYSSSALIAREQYHDMYFFVFRQIIWVLAGFGAMVAGMKISYKKLAYLSRPGIFVTLALLIAVLVTPLGHSVGGARRWLRLGPIGFQPSEMAKVIVVFYMASVLAKKYCSGGELDKKIIAPLMLVALAVFLVFKQPDFGSAVFLIVAAGGVFFIGGIKLKYMFTASLAMLPLIIIMLFARPYRRERLAAFLNPAQDMYGSGFQLYHSITALGSGGLSGFGLGTGLHKLFYIPEVHTDFVFAVIGQELGYIGSMTVVLLFVLFTWRGLSIAARQKDYLGSLIAGGLTFMITVQAAINIAVVTGVFPTKGIPLPFLSFGGSSLFFNMFAVGVILNISRTCSEGKK
ncbi:MAG: putative lipid II flippase FtsW [Elusimicrobiota bacterium]